MKKIIAFIMTLIMVLSITACAAGSENDKATEANTNKNNEASSTTGNGESAKPSGELPAETPEETFVIEAAGLELKYPAKWKDKVKVTVTDKRASFMRGDTALFDLVFNSEEGQILGTVCADNNTVIYIVTYDVGNTDMELISMLDDVNVILDHLMTDYNFTVGKAVEQSDDSTFDIETSLVTLKYPAKWKDIVTVKVSDDKVSLSNGETPLFDLIFKEGDGYLLGTYNGTPIYIVDYQVDTDEQAAMKEDVNVILQFLMQDENFVINN